MRSIFYGVFMAGAILGSAAMWLLAPEWALLATMTIPLIFLWGAELFGLVTFHRIDLDDDEDDILSRIQREGLTDREAIEKYGQQIINEVDLRIAHVEAQLANMKRNRAEMVRIMQEGK